MTKCEINLNNTFREGHDFIVYICGYSGLFHLLVTGCDAAVANVFPDGVVEKHRILGNHANMSSQRHLFHLRKDNAMTKGSL